jgi:hypothetical protein
MVMLHINGMHLILMAWKDKEMDSNLILEIIKFFLLLEQQVGLEDPLVVAKMEIIVLSIL